MEKKTHWKKLTNTNYLGSWDLEQGERRQLIIKEVKEEKLKASPAAEEEMCLVVYFTTGKPMVLNKTNAKAIEKATTTPYIEQWVGKTITVAAKSIRAFGETMDALRVEPFAPKPKQKAGLTDDRFDVGMAKVAAGEITMEQFKNGLEAFKLTKQQNDKLNSTSE